MQPQQGEGQEKVLTSWGLTKRNNCPEGNLWLNLKLFSPEKGKVNSVLPESYTTVAGESSCFVMASHSLCKGSSGRDLWGGPKKQAK